MLWPQPVLDAYSSARNGRQGGGEGLVVWRVDQADAVRREAIAKRQSGMVEVLGLDRDVVDVEGTLDDVVVADGRPELLQHSKGRRVRRGEGNGDLPTAVRG